MSLSEASSTDTGRGIAAAVGAPRRTAGKDRWKGGGVGRGLKSGGISGLRAPEASRIPPSKVNLQDPAEN
eukprot:CAMPEP_0173433634 /NCGR_PEP_ID=MMETSP1357-20121228/11009_1 /TAXON_ID=77926 /ORGANISM="Hemiselmis rufescens, Strain PCC563" /LENGTH=69 /DNA_ID=CAMNT_0014398357 /DNA_START=590 /DNA_END=799 /DNA_ORIENTATION=+